MKKQTLLPLLAVVLCVSGFLWLNASRPALLENGSLPPEGPDTSDTGGAPIVTIPDSGSGVPLTAAPEPAPDQSGEAEDPWAQFSQAQMDAMHEVLRLVNEARAEENLPALELEPALCGAARVRAQECVGTFSHTRPDGTKYKTAITEAGITSGYTGENAATGHSTAKQVVDAWLRSEGHRANILNERFTRLGVGFEKNTGNQYRGYTWVELFIDG